MPLTDKEKKREYERQYRQGHKSEGLCIFCNQPIVKNTVMCVFHLDYSKRFMRHKRENPIYAKQHREDIRNRYQLLKMNNRCVTCGMPLNNESRIGVKCLSCYTRDYRYGY